MPTNHKHGLWFEGSPFSADGKTRLNIGTGGEGHALCRCGTVSPESLPSGNARKKWHRQHKISVGIGGL